MYIYISFQEGTNSTFQSKMMAPNTIVREANEATVRKSGVLFVSKKCQSGWTDGRMNQSSRLVLCRHIRSCRQQHQILVVVP